MLTSIALLILSGGLPYYLFLEKSKKLSSETILLISSMLLLGAVALTMFVPNEHSEPLVIIALVSAVFTIYKATKTTNFYKFSYYLIFVNAPFFLLFEERGALYSISLLVAILGISFIARFYKKHYGSANYHYITGTILSTPYVGTHLIVYLVALALYPPFPNSVYFLSHVFNSEPNLLWYAVVVILFFGNFYLAMGVMQKTVFGKPNHNIHYVDMSVKEKVSHFLVVATLLTLSFYGVKEILL